MVANVVSKGRCEVSSLDFEEEEERGKGRDEDNGDEKRSRLDSPYVKSQIKGITSPNSFVE